MCVISSPPNSDIVICVQVAVATFKDPPHQVHKTWPMPGTILSAPSLSTMDVPLQGTLWCMQHDKRMAQRNGQLPADRRDYDRRDYRHGVVVCSSMHCGRLNAFLGL
jgi:hypothetical protein